jgi:hypothetical protein
MESLWQPYMHNLASQFNNCYVCPAVQRFSGLLHQISNPQVNHLPIHKTTRELRVTQYFHFQSFLRLVF